MEIEKEVYTVSEIQKMLCISRNTAYALVKNPPFPIIKIGDTYRVSRKVFDNWLYNQK